MVRAALVATFLVLCLPALSQPPSPSTGKHTRHEQPHASQPAQSASPDQRGTEHSPLVVKVIPPESAGSHAQEQPDKRDAAPHEDRTLEIAAIVVTATATVVLAIFTVLLSVSTNRLWREAKTASVVRSN